MAIQPQFRSFDEFKRPDWLPAQAELLEHFKGFGKSASYRSILFQLVSCALPTDIELNVLDIGAGTGELAFSLMKYRPGTSTTCCDTYIRRERFDGIPFVQANGKSLPFSEKAFDVSILSNVLHHASNPTELLKEVIRVTRRVILIKDHLRTTSFDSFRLTLLDVLGNLRLANLGLSVTGKYLNWQQWLKLLDHPAISKITVVSDAAFRGLFMSQLFKNKLEIFFVVELHRLRNSQAL